MIIIGNGCVDVGHHCVCLACGSCPFIMQAFLEAPCLGAELRVPAAWVGLLDVLDWVNRRPARSLHSTLAFWPGQLTALQPSVHVILEPGEPLL